MAELLTASDYARHRGVSPAAVSKAIESGRLKHCLVTSNGKVRITSAAMADLEWDANTNQAKAPPASGSATLPLEPAEESMSFNAASTAEKVWKSKLAELEYRSRVNELVDAKEVEARIVDDYTRCKTKLLGVPRRVKAALPHLTTTDVLAIDALIRESLEDLASNKPEGPLEDMAGAFGSAGDESEEAL